MLSLVALSEDEGKVSYQADMFEGGATRSRQAFRYDLVAISGIRAMARRMALGAEQHGASNWRRGGEQFRQATISHLMAHLLDYMERGNADDSNTDAIICNAMMLCEFEEREPLRVERSEGWQAVSLVDDAVKQLTIFEGLVSWMYLDTVGLVTVDMGIMLPNVGAALEQYFVIDNRRASDDEIRADYVRVKGMKGGRAEGFYYHASSPRIPQAVGIAMRTKMVQALDVQLGETLPGYTDAPHDVKLALLDMRYNLGQAGLIEGYPHLCRAVAAGDWVGAAANSWRNGPSQERNDWTACKFRSAVASESGVRA